MARMLGITHEIQFSEDGSAAPEQTLLRVGKFKHPKYGVVDITATHLQSFVANHAAKVRRVDDAVDFGHNTGGPAAAWLAGVRFDEKNGKLLFKPDWTPKGAESVKNKEYKYLSADFDLDYEDNESGKKFGPTLNGAGLTNRPFVKGMEAIQLSEGDSMNLEQALAMIEQLKAQLAQMQGQQQQGAGAMGALQAKFSEVETEVKSLREEKATRVKADELAGRNRQFDDLCKDGKACEAQRKAWLDNDMAAYAAAAETVKTIRLSEEEKEKARDAVGKDGPEAKIMQLAEVLVKDKKATDLGAGIAMILTDPAHKTVSDEYLKNVQL